MRALGSEVRQQREKYKYKLENIANKTKIQIDFLQAIEEGRFDFLPEFYVRNFFKLYLRRIGRNTQRFLDRYDEIMSYRNKEEINTRKSGRKSKSAEESRRSTLLDRAKSWKNKHFMLIAVFLLLTLMTVIYMVNHRAYSEKDAVAGSAAEEQTISEKRQPVSYSSLFTAQSDLQLELFAREQTWLQLSIDDSATTEYMFKAQTRATWNAQEKFLMRVGNAGGVTLVLNDKDLGILGNPMEVKDVLITKSGIEEIHRR
ncbi:DUF4115 domain-containing protein [candidate division KSB1 bacterium]|nr:DUF4115 domain-containing protein [candidate division KSB1 bacterium]